MLTLTLETFADLKRACLFLNSFRASLTPLFGIDQACKKNNNNDFSRKTQPFFFHTLLPNISDRGKRERVIKEQDTL
jgi:hypothetical protein